MIRLFRDIKVDLDKKKIMLSGMYKELGFNEISNQLIKENDSKVVNQFVSLMKFILSH